MKKILITTNHPAPYINQEIDVLKRNYEVNVIYHWRKDPHKTWKGFVGYEGKFCDQLSFVRFLSEYKKNDVAILGGWANKYCFFTILLSFLFHTKCCVFSDYPSPEVKKNIFYYIRKCLLFPSLDFIFCATESTRTFYHDVYGLPMSKLVFFPYKYNDSYTDENKTINAERERELQQSKEKINVFIANNFIERKGYKAVVDAFEILHNKNELNKFSVKIAGNGELFESVKSRLDALNESISFLGWIESDEYETLINNCDIYIHASTHEPFGIPPLDALGREKLLVASNGVQSVVSIIRNGVSGYLFNANDGESLADILLHIDRSSIYKIGREGRNVVTSMYSDEIYKNAIERVVL